VVALLFLQIFSLMRIRFVSIFLILQSLAIAQSVSTTTQTADNSTGPVVKMDTVSVEAKNQTFLNSIDRKIYNVGQDIQATTGSVSDLLQNIPSVEVDIDGNLSLRGESSVQVLIDGKSSALMGSASRADVLAQLPADSIERIEVITNPSAMYKPDGAGGIINIITKRKKAPGFSGSVKVTIGNKRRWSSSLRGSYNPGPYNVSWDLGLRQDDRIRIASDTRTSIDSPTGLANLTKTNTSEHSRPLSRLGQINISTNSSKTDKLTQSVDYNDRTFYRRSAELESSLSGTTQTLYYDRLRFDPEHEEDVQSKTDWEHTFGNEDQVLNAELKTEHHTELENNFYANEYNVPVSQTSYDTMRNFNGEPITEFTLEYSNPFSKNSKMELGYNQSNDKSYQDHYRELAASAMTPWTSDPLVSNRFILDQFIQSVYGTYRTKFGQLGILAGLRFEKSDVNTNQITSQIVNDTILYRLYPTLHLSYELSDLQELQLNYSHRVRRPESDDLNPFPQYQDPFNLRAGNPLLKPMETHSIEAGYQYKKDDTTYLVTLYYRYNYNGFTTVSQFLNSTTLLTTEENLASSSAGGLELISSTSPVKHLTLNLTADAFRSQIDASNLGFSTHESSMAYSGKFNAEYELSKVSMLQFNAVYTAKRLTPQGYRMPTFVSNVGYKHDFKNKNLSVVLTVSDLFNTLKEETILNTPQLKDDSMRKRSSRIVYASVIYTFGGSKKKGKNDSIQYDNNL
jgi:outer membrane receptor protein involved in Fe transport